MSGKKHGFLGAAATVAAGAAFGTWIYHERQKKYRNPAPETAPKSLCPTNVRQAIAEQLRLVLPTAAVVLVMSDDRGDLAHDLAGSCRMVFSARADGAASEARLAWPENIIRAECDLMHMWPAAESLDLAVLVNTLPCYPDVDAVLDELCRVSKTGGYLSLATTVRTDVFTPEAWKQCLQLFGVPVVHSWTKDELQALLTEHGWEIVCSNEYDAGLPMQHLLCCMG